MVFTPLLHNSVNVRCPSCNEDLGFSYDDLREEVVVQLNPLAALSLDCQHCGAFFYVQRYSERLYQIQPGNAPRCSHKEPVNDQ